MVTRNRNYGRENLDREAKVGRRNKITFQIYYCNIKFFNIHVFLAVAMTIDYDAEEIYWMVLQINGEVLLFKTDVDLMQEIVRVNERELTLAKGTFIISWKI